MPFLQIQVQVNDGGVGWSDSSVVRRDVGQELFLAGQAPITATHQRHRHLQLSGGVTPLVEFFAYQFSA